MVHGLHKSTYCVDVYLLKYMLFSDLCFTSTLLLLSGIDDGQSQFHFLLPCLFFPHTYRYNSLVDVI